MIITGAVSARSGKRKGDKAFEQFGPPVWESLA
jgi:hypothetical protein